MSIVLSLIIQVILGSIGSLIVNNIRAPSMGALYKLGSGAIGGIIGGIVLCSWIADGFWATLDFTNFIGNAFGGLAGGGLLATVVGAFMKRNESEK